MLIQNKNFTGHTYIMGILNVTPDSFSDGGKYNSPDAALKRAEEMIRDGADIIDIGGESTRPGFTPVTPSEEIERVCPVIEKIKHEFDIPVSVDTFKGETALAAAKAGADLINDIWGFKYDEKTAETVKKYGLSACLMHNRPNTEYSDFVNDVVNDLRESILIADKYNIPHEKLMTDPGVGFAKSYEQNLEIINNIDALEALGLPVLLGTSRKSVIGLTLNLPADERLEGTLATTVFAVMKNCLFVRVHDIKENKRIILMTEKILGKI